MKLIFDASDQIGTDRLLIAPSCSLLHVPLDVDLEESLDSEIRGWLAFAKQKIEEVVALTRAANLGVDSITETLRDNQTTIQSRQRSTKVNRPSVVERTQQITDDFFTRSNPFEERISKQRSLLQLPLLPTTTIGSFPQTGEVRKVRSQYRRGQVSQSEYETFLREETERCVA